MVVKRQFHTPVAGDLSQFVQTVGETVPLFPGVQHTFAFKHRYIHSALAAVSRFAAANYLGAHCFEEIE
ncbi:hypothetical protein D3C86_1921950 [compost metagenome]